MEIPGFSGKFSRNPLPDSGISLDFVGNKFALINPKFRVCYLALVRFSYQIVLFKTNFEFQNAPNIRGFFIPDRQSSLSNREISLKILMVEAADFTLPLGATLYYVGFVHY